MSDWAGWRAGVFSAADMDAQFLDLREPVPTGVAALDGHLGGGWQPGVNVVAAAPGCGKSALGVFTALAAAQRGDAAAVWTLEMSALDCWARACSCASASGVGGLEPFCWSGLGRMSRAYVASGGAECGEYVAASRYLAGSARGLAIVEPPSRDCADVAEAMRGCAAAGARLIVLDYLQYCTAAGMQPGYETVTAASHAFQAVARETGVPLVVVSSMGREAARGSEPDMHAGQGSGAIEYDATTFTALWRGEGRGPGGGELLRFRVCKNRRGPVSPEAGQVEYWPAYNFFGN